MIESIEHPVRGPNGILQRSILALILGLALFPATGGAETPPALNYSKPAIRRQIVEVVEAQLAAFRAGDFAEAYRFSAEPLRERFTLRDFALMIARGYAPILEHERAELGLPMDDGIRAVVSVRLWAGGEPVVYRYMLLKEDAGWRVAGVGAERPKESDA